jgi:hypothetical protein
MLGKGKRDAGNRREGMKESYKEDLASHFGHESYADDGNVVGVATAVVYAGKLWCRERCNPRMALFPLDEQKKEV